MLRKREVRERGYREGHRRSAGSDPSRMDGRMDLRTDVWVNE